ncbi:MAG: PAS domain-containing protein [Desulfovibrio sp.]|nr:PAS domain-containing protein [Desulfovibrio sp.]MBI4961186.1 PAS domain-containing protein [Desulfovibrio sp.]
MDKGKKNGPMVFFSLEPTTLRATMVSASAERELGCTPEECVASPDFWRSMIHPDDAAEVAAALAGLNDAGELALEYRLRCKDGEWRRVREHMMVRCGQDGTPMEILGCAYVVEERSAFEQALKESEARLRSISENAMEGLFQCTPEGRFLWMNPACARILGYDSAQEAVTLITDIESQVYADAQARRKVLAELMEKGTVEGRELRMLRRNGRGIWVSLSLWVVRGESGGGVSRIEGILEDITARKQAESERMLLATAVEQAVEGVAIITGGTWKVEYANPAFGKIARLERADVLGRDFFDLFSGCRPPLPSRDIRHALQAGLEWTGMIKDSSSRSKPLAAEAVFSPVRDEAGRITNIVLLLRDIAYQNRLEKRLSRAHKLEAVGTLAGGIAHDFNNILTPILLNAEVGMQLLQTGDILRRPLEEIIQAGGRARQLIKQILVFSRRGDLRATRIELKPIVQETLRLMRAGLPPDVEVRLEDAGEPLEILADPSLVHQMVENLADNALHAMQGRGGTLTIGLAKREIDPEKSTGDTPLAPGEYAVLAVEDTGHGMDKSLMERIFTPFFTTRKPGEGTGMGLSTVHGIVRSLGGGVRVESELGKGSRFEAYLPLAGPAPRQAQTGQKRRALVVDTHAFARRAIAMTLGELGFKTTMMRDATKALNAFSRIPEKFDVVLAGEDLHGVSGRSFLQSCRNVDKEAKLVLLSDRDESASYAGAADVILQKPVSSAALAAALDTPEILGKGRSFSEKA